MYVNIHATICPVGIVTVNKVSTRDILQNFHNAFLKGPQEFFR